MVVSARELLYTNQGLDNLKLATEIHRLDRFHLQHTDLYAEEKKRANGMLFKMNNHWEAAVNEMLGVEMNDMLTTTGVSAGIHLFAGSGNIAGRAGLNLIDPFLFSFSAINKLRFNKYFVSNQGYRYLFIDHSEDTVGRLGKDSQGLDLSQTVA